jgi:hypothetical protein
LPACGRHLRPFSGACGAFQWPTPHFKTVFNVYYFPLHGCCYLFLSPPQKKYKKFKNIVGRKPFGLFFLKIKFSLSIAQKMTKDWLRKFKNTKIEI